MVTRISCGQSMKSALHYNEAKLADGKATLLLSSRFGCNADDLSVRQKLARFETLISRNCKVKTNTLHISLNFAPGEQLAPATLQQLAADYMQRIGFSEQPFLVYQHHDAGHPHLHIVTTNIRANGRPISLHNIGRLKSEPARKALEQVYGLVVAEGRRQRLELPPIVTPAAYGRGETKAAISNIVREITTTFQYTSLEELNAILRHYNIAASRGEPGSLSWNRRALVYSIIDKDGGKVGVPIPASSIYSKPILSALERRMERNHVAGTYKRQRLRQVLEKVLVSSSPAAARKFLERNNITCRITESKGIRDLFLIDHHNRTVISANKEGYSAMHVEYALRTERVGPGNQTMGQSPSILQATLAKSAELLRELTAEVDPHAEYLSGEMLKRQRRRRRS